MTESIWYFPYELQPLSRLSARSGAAPRHGALLRSGGGYADLHPWPELSDPPLEVQLEMLARGEVTELTKASLRFASIDAAARRDRVSLFAGLEIPASHFLIPDLDSPIDIGRIAHAGFDRVKIKMGRNLETEIGKLSHLLPAIREPGLRLRIDFNESADERGIETVLERIDRERIDFLEDPLPYDPSVWSRISTRHQIRLGADRPDPEKLCRDRLEAGVARRSAGLRGSDADRCRGGSHLEHGSSRRADGRSIGGGEKHGAGRCLRPAQPHCLCAQ